MFKVFRETNDWVLRYSGWRYAIPALILSFIGWIAAEIIWFKDKREEREIFAKHV